MSACLNLFYGVVLEILGNDVSSSNVLRTNKRQFNSIENLSTAESMEAVFLFTMLSIPHISAK